MKNDEACFSKFHVIRLSKNIYGKTPRQYLIAVRIEKAGQLLQTGIPVSDACFSVGFERLITFSGLFRRVAGTPPSVYLAIKRQVMETRLKFVPGCFADKNGWIQNRNCEETA